MSWILSNASKRIYWGDEPQDVVDDEIAKELGNDFYSRKISKQEKNKVLDKLIENGQLRDKVNQVYRKEWHRPVSDDEYINLISVALNIHPTSSTRVLRTNRKGKRT